MSETLVQDPAPAASEPLFLQDCDPGDENDHPAIMARELEEILSRMQPDAM